MTLVCTFVPSKRKLFRTQLAGQTSCGCCYLVVCVSQVRSTDVHTCVTDAGLQGLNIPAELPVKEATIRCSALNLTTSEDHKQRFCYDGKCDGCASARCELTFSVPYICSSGLHSHMTSHTVCVPCDTATAASGPPCHSIAAAPEARE